MIPHFQAPQHTHVVTHKTAVKLLHQRAFRELLSFYMVQPATVGQAAQALGLDIKSTYNKVQQLVQHELLTLSHTQPRAGRAIRWYRASADDYFAPFAASGFSDYAQWIASQTQHMHDVTMRELEGFLQQHHPQQFGIRLFKDPAGKTHLLLSTQDNWQSNLVLNQLLQPESPALLHASAELELSLEQAKALQLELANLWSKYYFLNLEQPLSAPQRFVLGVNLAPYRQ